MAVVKAFSIDGQKAWFWSLDHDPPHFHVKRPGEWEIKVHFLDLPETMIEVVWANKPPARIVLKELTSHAEAHRVKLLEQWEEIHKND